MAIRAIIKLTSLAEIEAVLAFCNSLSLPLDLVPQLGDRRRSSRITGNATATTERKRTRLDGQLYANYLTTEQKRARKAELYTYKEIAEPVAERKLLARTVKLIEANGGSMSRGEIVAALAKARHLPHKVVGSKVQAWVRLGALVLK